MTNIKSVSCFYKTATQNCQRMNVSLRAAVINRLV